MLIGYARVSTEDQNLDLQRNALREAGCKKIFEKESGRAGTKRPAFEAALAYLRPEDQLVVWKVDRLGRSLREMLDTAHMLQSRGIKLRSLTEQVDTETATGRLMIKDPRRKRRGIAVCRCSSMGLTPQAAGNVTQRDSSEAEFVARIGRLASGDG